MKSVSKRESKSKILARIELTLKALQSHTPHPRCELVYFTPYQLLVSVVLSAQATDKSVNAAMAPLYEKPAGETPFGTDDVLALGESGFLEKIRRIGLAPTKSKNVLKLTRIIEDQYGGKIPRTRSALEALPGVGRKTANVILGEIFREPTLAVDTHVFRVTKRLGFHAEATPEKAEHVLLGLISSSWLPEAHHWFILLGRYTCLARNPRCDVCILANICPTRKVPF